MGDLKQNTHLRLDVKKFQSARIHAIKVKTASLFPRESFKPTLSAISVTSSVASPGLITPARCSRPIEFSPPSYLQPGLFSDLAMAPALHPRIDSNLGFKPQIYILSRSLVVLKATFASGLTLLGRDAQRARAGMFLGFPRQPPEQLELQTVF